MRSIFVACLFVLACASTAFSQEGMVIRISVENRTLRLMKGDQVILSGPVAVGMDKSFSYQGKTYYFSTPRGKRKVISKAANPSWRPPDWHYYEVGKADGLPVRHVKEGQKIKLSDGTTMEVRNGQLGRSNSYGIFWSWPVGKEVVIDGTVYVPPHSTAQRAVPEALGPYALYMGDGYMIHGTHENNASSVGEAVSHGCVRLNNDLLAQLYKMVPVGTPIYIE